MKLVAFLSVNIPVFLFISPLSQSAFDFKFRLLCLSLSLSFTLILTLSSLSICLSVSLVFFFCCVLLSVYLSLCLSPSVFVPHSLCISPLFELPPGTTVPITYHSTRNLAAFQMQSPAKGGLHGSATMLAQSAWRCMSTMLHNRKRKAKDVNANHRYLKSKIDLSA